MKKILEVKHLKVSPINEPRKILVDDVSFDLYPGRTTCIVGESGSGKSLTALSIMKLLSTQLKQTGDIYFEGKNIDNILTMTVDDSLEFFKAANLTKIVQKLQPLQDVGLGYVQLGQSSSTLSGGEAQRIKLASFLVKGSTKDKALFVFDEPTTGLHFHDIKKLLTSFDALIDKGHSIIVIEHNLDMIKCADYIIDLGPEGGENGGQILAVGTPEEIIKNKASITGEYLKKKLK
jgi:excinuclease ABC subunit A